MSDTTLAWISVAVAIVFGLGAIGATLYVHRKQYPRREFSYDVDFAPLVSDRVRGLDKLSVAYADSPVKSPYIVSVQVASTGRADISSARFDGQKPIVFDLKVPILSEIEQSANLGTVGARLKYVERQSALELPPALLPKGFRIRAFYLCDGKPNFEPKIELADISIKDASTMRPRKWHERPLRTLVVAVLLGVCGYSVGYQLGYYLAHIWYGFQ